MLRLNWKLDSNSRRLSLFVIYILNNGDVRAVKHNLTGSKISNTTFPTCGSCLAICIYVINVHHGTFLSLLISLPKISIWRDYAPEKHHLHWKTTHQTRTVKGRNLIFFICNWPLVRVSSFKSAINLQGSVVDVWVVHGLHWEETWKNGHLMTYKV